MFQEDLETEYQKQIASEYQSAIAERERVAQYKPIFDTLVSSIMQELQKSSGVFGINNEVAQRAAANFMLKAYGIDATQWFQHYI